jgi:hypothetical protein
MPKQRPVQGEMIAKSSNGYEMLEVLRKKQETESEIGYANRLDNKDTEKRIRIRTSRDPWNIPVQNTLPRY